MPEGDGTPPETSASYIPRQVAEVRNHAVLKPDLNGPAIAASAAVCRRCGGGHRGVRPSDVPLAFALLRGRNITMDAVVDSPHGGHGQATRALDGRLAIDDGGQVRNLIQDIGKFHWDGHNHPSPDIGGVVHMAQRLRLGCTAQVLDGGTSYGHD